jgi:uncharacterized protein (TIGR02391 family)
LGFVASKLPSANEVVELPADDLGLRLLRLIVEEGQGHLLSRSVVANPSYWADEVGGEISREFLEAMAEAWDWLILNRLVAMQIGEGSINGHAYVTKRGKEVLAAEDGLALIRAEKLLELDLHPLLAEKIRRQFLLGEYELAALAAMREIEIRVRKLSNAKASAFGTKLMQSAFSVDNGPLTDPFLPGSEQEGTMALFRGAIGVFKNPSSHRQVEFDDPTFAAEVVLFADLLLRMLDRTEARINKREFFDELIKESDRRSEAARKGHETRRRKKGLSP